MSKLDTETAVKGVLDSVVGNILSGWASDPAEVAAQVDIRIDGQLVSFVKANSHRLDLHELGIGNKAFSYHVGQEYCDDVAHLIDLDVKGERFFSGEFRCQPDAYVDDALSGVTFNYDGTIAGTVSGWVHDPQSAPAAIEVQIDGHNFGQFLANKSRPDLDDAGLVNCAFEYMVPAEFWDGKIHELKFNLLRSGGLLFGGSKKFLYKGPARRQVSEWTWFSPTEPGQPAMSVIIPTFNRAGMLKETLENLLETIGDDPVEIIVVDDGSTDNTPDILHVMRARYTYKLRFERVPNGGPGRARNIGASLSIAPLIMFLGDDTRGVDRNLFRAHAAAHALSDSLGHVVLGKIVWPDAADRIPNFVMAHIQGQGQEQFGYAAMTPWHKYSHWAFYTANVSVKRSIVSDWMSEGFDSDFTLAAFEDAEFAYRVSKRYSDFGIFYAANSVVEHHHPYDFESFLRRQTSAGMMMHVMLEKHPELSDQLLGARLANILKGSVSESSYALPHNHYSTMIEGIKSWGIILDKTRGLGSQNWHHVFLSAIFRVAVLDGFLMLKSKHPDVQMQAYRIVIDEFTERMRGALSREMLGENANNYGF